MDSNVIVHNIITKLDVKLVKQNPRHINHAQSLQIKEEIQKLLDAKFIFPIGYPQWVPNMVPVGKPEGCIRFYIDLIDLNIAYLKYNFPIPNIDTLVDNMAGYEMLSLMDSILGYNQIQVSPHDQHKTTFIIPQRMLSYKIMPFHLKNVDATNQHAMTYIFHDMIHDLVEDYVNDLHSKSRTRDQHWEVLEKVFSWLLNHNIILNPRNYVFIFTYGKLLGFIISNQGIDFDPNKVIAITSIPLPHDLKTLRSIQGKIQAIKYFIVQLSNKCQPFNELLKKNVQFELEKNYQKAYDDIKQYLLNPLVLIPPKDGIPFYSYLLAIDFTLGIMLAHKNKQAKEQAIYQLNQTLVEYEIKCIYIEKVYLVVVFVAKKLWYYMLNHTTYIFLGPIH